MVLFFNILFNYSFMITLINNSHYYIKHENMRRIINDPIS